MSRKLALLAAGASFALGWASRRYIRWVDFPLAEVCEKLENKAGACQVYQVGLRDDGVMVWRIP